MSHSGLGLKLTNKASPKTLSNADCRRVLIHTWLQPNEKHNRRGSRRKQRRGAQRISIRPPLDSLLLACGGARYAYNERIDIQFTPIKDARTLDVVTRVSLSLGNSHFASIPCENHIASPTTQRVGGVLFLHLWYFVGREV